MIYMAGIGDLLNRKTWWIDGSVGCKQVRKTIQAEKSPQRFGAQRQK
jgi:hypothetical protein